MNQLHVSTWRLLLLAYCVSLPAAVELRQVCDCCTDVYVIEGGAILLHKNVKLQTAAMHKLLNDHTTLMQSILHDAWALAVPVPYQPTHGM